MAKRPKSGRKKTHPHRGRIQAQGGGIEKSVSWSRQTPPSESEMMSMVRELESMLPPAELKLRARPFEQLRRLIHNGATTGSLPLLSASFALLSDQEIRVDIEVLKGAAAVPNPKR